MTLVRVLIVIMSAAIGLALSWWLLQSDSRHYGQKLRITGAEFVIVSLLMALVFTPIITVIGAKLSRDNILRYDQFVNGVELAPIDDITICVGGHSGSSASSGHSNCDDTYVSGSYTYTDTCTRTVSHTSTDANGNTVTTTETETYPCTKTANIYTPYATREHSYSIPASVGFKALPTFNFRGVYLDANPVRYKKKIPVPRDRDYPWGPPADWTDSFIRYYAGDPRAVTALDSYDNYILASNDEVLKANSNRIDQYKKAGLLPDHTANIMKNPIKGPSESQADKVSFVGVQVADPAAWQKSLMRYNAACGLKLQCDLHVVLIDSAKMSDNDAVPYANAIKAYWQGPVFEKRAIAKNGIVLVLGVSNNTTIQWAEATTGMPHGNENMENHLRQYLPGTPLTPEALFGTPRTLIVGKKTTVIHQTPLGVVEDIMFNQVPFKRARMECNDGTCVGYKDEISRIDPTGWQKFWIVLVTLLIACILWYMVAMGSLIEDAWESLKVRLFTAPRPSGTDDDQVLEPEQGPTYGSASPYQHPRSYGSDDPLGDDVEQMFGSPGDTGQHHGSDSSIIEQLLGDHPEGKSR